MSKSCLFLLITMFFLFGCSFNDKVPSTGDEYLQGMWQDSIIEKEQLITYEQYSLKFTCDSFYLKISSFSKVNLAGGDCYNSTNWDEYVKGVYTVEKDTLKFNGAFVNEDYKYKPEGS